MTATAVLQIAYYLIILLALAVPLGHYMARVYTGEAHVAQRILDPVERLFYRLAGVRTDDDMTWQRYAGAVLWFNLLGILAVYALMRVQDALPFNQSNLGPVVPQVAWNTAVSFTSNTNWQAYGGESTLSYLTAMLALTVQNFMSAATGMAVLVALIRGFTRRSAQGIGNFWVDLTRGTLYVLLPLSCILAIVLVSQGVVQTLSPPVNTVLVDSSASAYGKGLLTQIIALGPVASQIAIKQLGTNGGGFFNANSAHPFENPTPLSNFLELESILLIPVALCFTFGAMVRDRRQGWALLSVMFLIFVPLLAICVSAEQAGNPLFASLGVDQHAGDLQAGGNMEGKEVRFGIVSSALWAVATTAASNGSVNAMHDSFTPLGGLVAMWLIQTGEIVFGGVGSGLYGMIVFAIVAVFIAGLLVGRTPEYLGKKIEAKEMKMVSLVILVPAAGVLIGTAIACVVPAGTAALGNPGIHGFSEILYAFSSTANNNGSAFAGLTASGIFYATTQGLTMLLGRYWIIIPILAIAGSLAAKKIVPPTSGTLPTHTPLFVLFLAGTIMLVGALTYFPALALGPIAEHLLIAAP
ncbi:MAG: potassium-transporting ATPase subunit KdpA [Cyanobacteria bacterium NC_groundwater_1444_Ag_S-0.65um_54_12]|nr:potassium-transporting ATPase subunit KdpA [Cyanobacteria bacterium NC_groundwater_1444_Ag_S-0.65um_54_12]